MHTQHTTRRIGLAVALVLTFSFILITAPVAQAAPEPTSDLLLPYFEVQMDSPGLTTLFSVVNTSNEPVPIIVGIHSNWGVEILQVPLVLDPHQSQSVNLRDWLVNGALPDGIQLEAAKVAHVQAALCGQESPQDGLYYSTEIQDQLAVGYVTVRAQGSPRPDVLFGDFFVVDPRENFAQGERLINIDPLDPCGNGLCERHAVRFLQGGGFDGGTELIVWTPGRIQPEEGPVLGSMASVLLDTNAFEEPGVFLGQRNVTTLPVQVVRVADLGFSEDFGWLELTTEERSFVGVRYDADQRFSVGLVSTCLPETFPPGPGLRIEKSTNGVDADNKPGPSIAVGEPIVWEYIVTNTGAVDLTDVVVFDDDDGLTVVCPKTTLAVGESMICKAEGEAQACDYVNTGTASGLADGFGSVFDSDLSHYFGSQQAAISLDLTVNGEQADKAPGIPVRVGDTLTLRYLVTNTGDAPLEDVVVLDGDGKEVACPADSLGAGESMTCTVQRTYDSATIHEATAQVRGQDSCGAAANAADKVFFDCECVEGTPSIRIEKATNGQDADSWATAVKIGPGESITWTYVVTNDGETALHDVDVADDDAGLTVSCPKTKLAVGQSMTCTAHGTAGDGRYKNVGLVTALSECDAAVLDTDPSHYEPPELQCPFPVPFSVSIETRIDGQDADASPGVQVATGSTLAWRYVVTNSGDSLLFDLEVTDALGLAISCPKNQLAAGESMTCSASSTAAEGTHGNVGFVSGDASDDPECPLSVDASDPAWYTGKLVCDDSIEAKIHVETYVNGHKADSSPGEHVAIGSTLSWTYEVTNTGNSKLFGVTVSDSLGLAISCPASELAPGASMTCSASSIAKEGIHFNRGEASGHTGGEPECREKAWDDDKAWYKGKLICDDSIEAKIHVETYVNGHKADSSPGEYVAIGSTLSWTYKVTNTGSSKLFGVTVSDSLGLAISCPASELAPGASMTCSASSIAKEGIHYNRGQVSGHTGGEPECRKNAWDDDKAWYKGKLICDDSLEAKIDVETRVNGHKADSSPGLYVDEGDLLTWTYEVTNRGGSTLHDVTVSDSLGLSISCPSSTLAPGASMTCSATSFAKEGIHYNRGKASGHTGGEPKCRKSDEDDDKAWYKGKEKKVSYQGCTPGYWKNHTDSWAATGYKTWHSIKGVFPEANDYSGIRSKNLHQALYFGGGSSTEDAAKILLRAAVAGLLDSAHPDVHYPRSTSSLIADVDAALGSHSRSTMLSLASAIDADNNLGCPLN